MIYTVRIRYFSDLSARGKVLSIMMVSAAVLFVVVWSSYNGILPGAIGQRSVSVDGKSDIYYTSQANASSKFYGIMFDAGSTGSRIHLFIFYKGKDGSTKLDSEIFLQIKPGLSSYADNPVKGAESLKGMLDKAKETIPSNQWKSTPIALKATAGLRLLPKEKSDAILKEVEELIKSYPFHVVNNAVTIMGGTEEGLYSWVTLNFLLGSVNTPERTSGMMDLGGGSTQITFYPTVQETRNSLKGDFKVPFSVKGRKVDLYTHSYLGLGLMSARHAIFKLGEDKSGTSLSSPCLPTGGEDTWKFQSKEYKVRGTDVKSEKRYDACYSLAKKVVTGQSVHQPKEVIDVPFYIFSYYYDRAAETGLIDSEKGGDLTLSHFIKKAKEICAKPSTKEIFQCMDLSYISSLLQDGFGFKHDKILHLRKKIKGVETAWCLGAMFNVMNQLEEVKS